MKTVCILLAGILMVAAAQTAVARTPYMSPDSPVETTSASAGSSNAFWRGWSMPINISQSPNNTALYPTLGVASGGQAVYLAWTDGRASVKNSYYAVSTDGGWQWGGAQPVVATAADSWRPNMVVSGAAPFIAWAESTGVMEQDTYQIALGTGSKLQVPNNQTVLAYAPRLAAGPGGELHIVLQGGSGTKPDILYSRRSAGQAAWPAATVVFEHEASGSHNPDIAVSADGATVHLVWQENFSGDRSEIYYLRGHWSAGTLSWDSPISLSAGITRSVRPAIVVDYNSQDSQELYVVWGEQDPGFRVQYVRFSRSQDGGGTWSAPTRVSAEAVSANNVAPTDVAPRVVVAPSGTVCVTWHGFMSGAVIEAEEIYLACSPAGDANWSVPVNVSYSPNSISIRPVLAIGSDGILHLAWQELAGSDPVSEYQIYYAHSFPHLVLLPVVWR